MKKYMILLAASLMLGACGKDDNDTPDVQSVPYLSIWEQTTISRHCPKRTYWS